VRAAGRGAGRRRSAAQSGGAVQRAAAARSRGGAGVETHLSASSCRVGPVSAIAFVGPERGASLAVGGEGCRARFQRSPLAGPRIGRPPLSFSSCLICQLDFGDVGCGRRGLAARWRGVKGWGSSTLVAQPAAAAHTHSPPSFAQARAAASGTPRAPRPLSRQRTQAAAPPARSLARSLAAAPPLPPQQRGRPPWGRPPPWRAPPCPRRTSRG